jgi:hypothetical protein
MRKLLKRFAAQPLWVQVAVQLGVGLAISLLLTCLLGGGGVFFFLPLLLVGLGGMKHNGSDSN